LVQNGYDFIKPDLEIINKGLTQQKLKIENEVTFRNTMNATQEMIN
jgi:hypothetical protein